MSTVYIKKGSYSSLYRVRVEAAQGSAHTTTYTLLGAKLWAIRKLRSLEKSATTRKYSTRRVGTLPVPYLEREPDLSAWIPPFNLEEEHRRQGKEYSK